MKRSIIVFCLGVGLTLIAAGMVPLLYSAPVAQAQQPPEETLEPGAAEPTAEATLVVPSEPIEPTGDNSYCAVCHSQPYRAVTLEDGFVLNLFAVPALIENSVHGPTEDHPGLGCIDCHGNNTFPHNGPTPQNARDYTLEAVTMCYTCHQDQAIDLASGLHEQAIARGDKAAAVCTDCHGAHIIRPAANEPQLVAGVCGTCHTSTLDEWRNSPHVDIGPLGCATCHSPHSQELRVGDSNELCVNCHNAPSEIYVHQEHLNSAFDVACIDCHMFRSPDVQVSLINFTPTGHSMTLDTQPCNTCHEELEVSGEWSRLVRGIQEEIISERDDLQAQVTALEGQVQEGTDETSSVSLIQGLIVGLGLGISFAMVMIPRLMRRNSSVVREKDTEDERE